MKRSAGVLFALSLVAATAAAFWGSSGCSSTRFSPTFTPVSCTARIAINPCSAGYTIRVQLDNGSVYYGTPTTQVLLTLDVSSGKQHAVEWRILDSGGLTVVDSGTAVWSDVSKNPCIDVVVPCQ